MTDQFQQDLVEICKNGGTPIARVDSVFAASSPHGIVGRELILEHLHPNVRGYFLMAKEFYRAILAYSLLGVPATSASPEAWNDDVVLRRSAVSVFDSLAGAIKVSLLINKWPFVPNGRGPGFSPSTGEDSIVLAYVQGKHFWSDARYRLATLYAARGDFERARVECFAVHKVVPFSYEPLLRVADYYRAEGRNREADAWYRKSIEKEDNPFARMKLGIVLLEREQSREAALHIEEALRLSASGRYKLRPDASVTARYLLGVAYAKVGDFSNARATLEAALAVDPHNEESQHLLRQIETLSPSRGRP
jgi:tetratricopeptide (TPR) repeat protein